MIIADVVGSIISGFSLAGGLLSLYEKQFWFSIGFLVIYLIILFASIGFNQRDQAQNESTWYWQGYDHGVKVTTLLNEEQ